MLTYNAGTAGKIILMLENVCFVSVLAVHLETLALTN